MKKVLLFIASEKGYTALKKVLDEDFKKYVGAVVTFTETDVEISWDRFIKEICEQKSIPCYDWKNAKNRLEHIIQANHITGVCAISWKYLLPLSINEYLEDPLIVFHDSLLPHYRGFAPTPTAIMCGETEIGVTAIFATNQMDQGDIILQKSVYISEDMYIKEVIHELAKVCGDMLKQIIEQMVQNRMQAYPQNEDEATYSIWRGPEDCQIDWNKSAYEIYNFIRAVGNPYPGAFSFMNNQKIRILRTEIMPYDYKFAVRDTGKIFRISDNMPEIICGTGILKILSAVDDEGNAVKFHRLRCRLL